jgi:hypothetical protein
MLNRGNIARQTPALKVSYDRIFRSATESLKLPHFNKVIIKFGDAGSKPAGVFLGLKGDFNCNLFRICRLLAVWVV